METNLTVVEWSPDGTRAYNPVTRQTASGASVQEALRKVGGGGTVGLCLGRRVSFVRETHAPDVDKAQMHMIMSLQIETLFPAMNTELAFDFEKGTHRFDDGMQTMVAAAPTETVRRAIAEVDAAGARIAWIAPVCVGAKQVAKMQGHDDAIVVEIAEGHMNLDIVRHGMVVFSRSTVDPGNPDGRHSEVLRTLAGYGLTSAAILAVGDAQLGTDVDRCPEGPLQAMALHTAQALNVELPETVAQRLRRASRSRGRVALFLWLGVLVVGAVVWMDRDAASKAIVSIDSAAGRSRADVQEDIDQIDTRLRGATTNLKNLNTAFTPAQPISDVLTLVSNEVPQGAWLTGVTFERGKPILIRGTALSSDAVSAYTSSLALESRFRDVQLVFANNAEIEGTPVVQFAVSAHVVGNLPLIDTTGSVRSAR